MKIQYNLTEQDYINYNLFHLRNSKMERKAMILIRYVVPFFVLIQLSALYKASPIQGLLIALILYIVWIIYCPKLISLMTIKLAKNMIRNSKSGIVLGDHYMMLTDEEIVDSSLHGEIKLKWSGVKELKEDNHCFYICLNTTGAYILPKRDITNQEEIRNYFHINLS